MNHSRLGKFTYTELRDIALDMGIKPRKSKDKLIKDITEYIKNYNNSITYERQKQLGDRGKEGVTYLVRSPGESKYAMKTFRKRKSSNTLRKEAELQRQASTVGICPNIVDINTEDKYIVMQKMDKHLVEVMKEQNGDLTIQQQKQIVKIFKNLDNVKVFHGDSNIMNYMYKGRKLYIIDFGMSKYIDNKLIKKLGTSTPNMDIGLLGFILKLKELKTPSSAYSHLKTFISESDRQRFKL